MNRTPLIGAIVGDIAGSRFEWRNCKSKDFTFLVGRGEGEIPCCFKDNTVITFAIEHMYPGESPDADKSVFPASLKVRNLRSYP